MKLRTKIFLLIGGIFVISFLVAQILDEIVTTKLVKKSELQIDKQISHRNSNKRNAVEVYMKTELQYAQAKTRALLQRVKSATYWADAFKPSEFNLQTNTWLSAATLLSNNKRLDLIQNINNEKLSSLIILDEPPPYHVLNLPFLEDIKIAVVDPQLPGKELEGPFIAIPFPFNSLSYVKYPNISSPMAQANPELNFYLFYDPRYVMEFDLESVNKKIEEFKVIAFSKHLTDTKLNFEQLSALAESVELVKQGLVKAQKHLKENPQLAQKLSYTKKEWLHEQFENQYDVVSGHNELYNIDQIMIDRYDQVNLIWQILALNATGIHDYDPLAFSAPKGISHIVKDQVIGKSILTESLFFDRQIERLTDQVFTADAGRVFIGETTGFDSINDSSINQGTLTLGVDIRNILKGLTVASEDNALLVVNGQVIKSYDVHGVEFTYKNGSFPLVEILKKDQGVFKSKLGKEYYYISVRPIVDDNVRVILFNTKNKEFVLLDLASSVAKKLSRQISFQMSIIGLLTIIIVMFVIHFVSRKVTTPITILADSARKVKEGDLEKVELSLQDHDTKDEIGDLYRSFHDMIIGLKEKEKVKGVLNKVVSPEIANKILEGQVELGGEEKIVTTLFVDVRHFTELTEKIPPAELIKVLNVYMTLLSKIVDEHNGVIDKYVGDQVMALFGAPLSSDESAFRAVECGLAMIERVREFNRHRKGESKLTFDIGVGIHTGIVVAGNMGAENRMNYTVLGANVNLAARLCSFAKEMQLLISKETLESYKVKEAISFTELKAITLKGFSQPVLVFEVFPKEKN
ncbi:MAG: adenylate/guanylate cyclase domain-containing protein [Rhabdochlamydiaceae bacterium]|nr:adenylate/guanylate cyclase domain-containing protein [Candidatus Amphrikana amoebophyrae]